MLSGDSSFLNTVNLSDFIYAYRWPMNIQKVILTTAVDSIRGLTVVIEQLFEINATRKLRYQKF